MTDWLTAYRDKRTDIEMGRAVMDNTLYSHWRTGRGAKCETLGPHHRRLCPFNMPLDECDCNVKKLFVNIFGDGITDDSQFYSVDQIIPRAKKILNLPSHRGQAVSLPSVPALRDLCLVVVPVGARLIPELRERKSQLIFNQCTHCNGLKFAHNMHRKCGRAKN